MRGKRVLSTMCYLAAIPAISGQAGDEHSVCDALKPHGGSSSEMIFRTHVTPTMHAGLQVSDERCPTTLLRLKDAPGDPQQRAALSLANDARLYEKPYSLVIVGRIETIDGQHTLVAKSIEFSARNP